MTVLGELCTRVTMYSVATAVLLTAFCVLLVTDVLLNREATFGLAATISLAVLSLSGAVLFLVMGDRLGPWPALLLVFANAVTIVLFITLLRAPTGAIGMIVQVPVMALYLGAFLKPWLARFAQAAVLLMLGMAVMWDPLQLLDRLGDGRNGVSIVIFAWLCLEAGIFVQKRFKRETHIDELTGVYNRRGLVDRGDVERARAARSGLPICVAVADLDGFKVVNDTRGHGEGDRVLKDLTRQWKTLMRETDAIARIGGDEFILLLPDTGIDGARELLRRMSEATAYPWSWGVVEWNPSELLSIAIAHADEEMYRNKLARREAKFSALFNASEIDVPAEAEAVLAEETPTGGAVLAEETPDAR